MVDLKVEMSVVGLVVWMVYVSVVMLEYYLDEQKVVLLGNA
jgi:hypothetical protein